MGKMELGEFLARLAIIEGKLDDVMERVRSLPLDLHLMFYEDIVDAMENRLKVLERNG